MVRRFSEKAGSARHVPSHHYLRDPERWLRVRDRHTLGVLPAGPDAEPEVRANHVYALQDLGAVARKGSAAHRLAHPALLYHIALGHLEDEIPVDGIHLPPSHLPYKEPLL